jgi:hypothetical protein
MRLTKIDQLMNQLIFAFMEMGMSYRQAEDEMFRRLKRKRFFKEIEDDSETRSLASPLMRRSSGPRLYLLQAANEQARNQFRSQPVGLD